MVTLGFVFAILASALYAGVNKMDEGLVRFLSKDKEDPVAPLVIFSSLTAIVAVIVLGSISGGQVFSVPTNQILCLIGTGVMTIIAITLYLYALGEDEASVVVPIFQTVPVFGYGLGFLLLGETLALPQIIAGTVMVGSAILLTIEFGEKISLKSKTLVLMLGSSLLYAGADTLFKGSALDEVGFVTGSFWRFVGYLSVGPIFCLIPKYQQEFVSLIKTRKTVLSFCLGGEGACQIGDLIINYSLLLAPVSIVLLALSFQPAFVLLFGIILARECPQLFTEESDHKMLIQKGAVVTVMVIASHWII